MTMLQTGFKDEHEEPVGFIELSVGFGGAVSEGVLGHVNQLMTDILDTPYEWSMLKLDESLAPSIALVFAEATLECPRCHGEGQYTEHALTQASEEVEELIRDCPCRDRWERVQLAALHSSMSLETAWALSLACRSLGSLAVEYGPQTEVWDAATAFSYMFNRPPPGE